MSLLYTVGTRLTPWLRIRIGVLQEYHRSQGRLMLYFYNLTNVRITELDVKIPNVPFIVTKVCNGSLLLTITFVCCCSSYATIMPTTI